ncbi:MAG: pyruvate-formate lyase [Candidatus Latescibacteria bacterium]|jgi:pyruvate-formate lyase|nr:pyruvate-formate lyase [Candidatus Latescibacterota bacterium]
MKNAEITAGISYQERIDVLRQTKSENTGRQVKKRGYYDVDDDGRIPWEEEIPFEPKTNHPAGVCRGIRSIGANFRAWLEVHPVYIHPMSALAGAWIFTSIPGAKGWLPEDRPAHLVELHTKYNLKPGIGASNHFGPDLRIGLDLGWGGLLEKIRRYRDLNRPEDTSFYDGEEDVVLGVQAWIRRHVDYARQMADEERDPILSQNLLDIAEVNEHLIDSPPRTLREACQFLAWFQVIDRMWARGGALSQLDEMLRPYYEKDKAAGIITDDEEAIWCIASLFYNDTHYSQIGGPDPATGKDMTSRISFLILEAVHRLKIPSNIAVRLHDGLDPDLLRKSVEYLFEDGTGCCYACSKGLDEGYARNGVPIQLARKRAKVGCNWTALPGIEYCMQDVTRMCMATPFTLAFDEMMAAFEEPTLDALWARYVHHLSISVDTMKKGFDWHMERQADIWPELVLNLFMHGTIERGLNVTAGGVDIYNICCDGVGLATVADSFAAIQQRVVEEGRLTWAELAQHLEDDYQDAEHVRLMLKNIPRYGSGNSKGDAWAKKIAQTYTDLVRNTPTDNGFIIIPGLFSHGDILRIGKRVGATPNGRKAGEMVAHSADPDPGFMPDGGGAPTAKSNAVASVQPGWGNTTPLQIDLDTGLANQIGGVEAVEALFKGHAEQGGTLINVNVISKEQILEAHADPSKYPDLVVRVTGYSAYFRTLSPEYRQQVVDRILGAN